MEALVDHLLRPFIRDTDDFEVDAIEGESSVILEVALSDDDYEVLFADGGELVRSVRQVLSAASGSQKAVLEFVGDEEEVDEE